MRIQIRSRTVCVTRVLRAHVERRIGFALGRFGERIARVIVRLSDANGQRRGSAKRCQIDVGLRTRRVQAEDTDNDRFVAVDHATDRVARSIARVLDLEHERGEGRTGPQIRRESRK